MVGAEFIGGLGTRREEPHFQPRGAEGIEQEEGEDNGPGGQDGKDVGQKYKDQNQAGIEGKGAPKVMIHPIHRDHLLVHRRGQCLHCI